MFHTVSNKKYTILKRRNEKLKAVEYAGVDERMVNTVVLLSGVEGIQTVWSCSGHTETEQFEQYNKRKNNKSFKVNRKGNFYFIFALGKQGDPFMKFLSDLMRRNFRGYYLKAINLNFCFKEDGTNKTGKDLNHFETYPVWEFGFTCDIKDHGMYLNKIMYLNMRLKHFIIQHGINNK